MKHDDVQSWGRAPEPIEEEYDRRQAEVDSWATALGFWVGDVVVVYTPVGRETGVITNILMFEGQPPMAFIVDIGVDAEHPRTLVVPWGTAILEAVIPSAPEPPAQP